MKKWSSTQTVMDVMGPRRMKKWPSTQTGMDVTGPRKQMRTLIVTRAHTLNTNL